MALYSLRLRRALSLSSSLINHQRPFSSLPGVSSPPSLSSATLHPLNPSMDLSRPHHHLLRLPFQSRPFRSSTFSLSSRVRSPSYNNNIEDGKIDPGDILFEGCDYNHWLITMDFPKDPKPTPEEMVETYVQTCAKVLGSVEEAKRKIYACSTTTYTGFQVEVSEEVSEKFQGLPGVVFILPDSYIDPVNKEYGGDKYINGTIIPRPPPVQYGREGGRFRDRNRDFNRERNRDFNQRDQSRGPMPSQPGNSAYGNQGSMHGNARNYGPQQNPPPRQNYGPQGAGERRDPMPMNNAPGGQDNYQGDRRYNQGERGNYYSQGQRDFPSGGQRGYAQPEQRDFRGDGRNSAPPQGGTYGQGAGGTYGQGAGGTYVQGTGGTYGQGAGGTFGQGAGETYGQGAGGTHGQGAGGAYGQEGGGTYGQGARGTYGQGAGGTHGQGADGAPGQVFGSGDGQSYPRHGEDQRFLQVEQRSNMQGEQRTYTAMGHTATDQGRY